jgi:hypothetical protein
MLNIEPKQVLNQFESLTRTSLQTTFLSWYQYHQERINELQAILDPLKIYLVQTEEWTLIPEELWQEIEEINQRIIKWTTSLHYLSSDLELEQLIQNWSAQFETIEKNLPAEIQILIGNTFWQKQPDDSLLIRLRKRIYKLKRWLRLSLLKLNNLRRRLIKKNPLKVEEYQHHIPLHNFLYVYLGLPFKQFLFAEWQRLLQAVSGQYFVLQMKCCELNNKILLLDRFPAIFNLNEKITIFDELYELAEILKSIDETLQVLVGYEKQFRVRLDKILAEVAGRFQSAWNDARIFQINNRTYSQKRIRKINNRLNTQFNQSVLLWYDHYRGLRQDWQKSLQLALLQFQSAHSLRRIARTIHGKIKNSLGPVFEEILTLIQTAESRFTDIGSARDLEKLIKSESEVTLKTGLQPRLAGLIDTIHQVQIVTDLELFSKQISTQLEDTDLNVGVFIKRDTENSPPHSRLADIPLKEIIQKYFVSELTAANRPTINQTGDQLEKTIRSISEIDQILEHAFDTALNLIYQHAYELDLLEVRSIVHDAFLRIKKSMHHLNQEVDAIPQRATDALVKDLQQFENQMLQLSDTRKILDWKRRFQREHRPGGSHIFFKRIELFIRRFFLRSRIKKSSASPAAQDKTHPLLTEPTCISIETIGAFLRQVQSQIARLPFVYQRLFLLEPLTNQRFFCGREQEVAALRREYINWKNGSAASIMITGETGSGKTSLLNHIETRLFNSHPLIRIHPQEKLYSTPKLTEYLKKVFNYPQASTLTDIEKCLIQEEDNKICILEDLHHLFLRVVNGLDTLEKFLLLVTRTQHKIFWIITCNYQAWRYLDKSVNIARNFSRILNLGSISVDEMRSILIKRHKVSGFDIDFEVPGSLSKRRSFKKRFGRRVASRQRLLHDSFFSELNELSAGNIMIAVLHWLRAIHKFTEDKLILIPYVGFDTSCLDELPEEDRFTLDSILNHETLTAADHALIFRQIPENSSIQLARLHNYGLIIPDDLGFRINPLLYRPLVIRMSERNVLQ